MFGTLFDIVVTENNNTKHKKKFFKIIIFYLTFMNNFLYKNKKPWTIQFRVLDISFYTS